MTTTKPHPTETAAYWRDLARNERAFAAEARGRRMAPVESIVIHERNAKDYDARADAIERAAAPKPQEFSVGESIDPIASKLADAGRVEDAWFLRGVCDSMDDRLEREGAAEAGPYVADYLRGFRSYPA